MKSAPYLNPDPFCRFIGPKNWGEALIDDKVTTCLLDNGSQLNFVTPAYAQERGIGHIVLGRSHQGDRRTAASHLRYGRWYDKTGRVRNNECTCTLCQGVQ